MPFWQRSLVLVVVVIAVRYIFVMVRQSVPGFDLPGYIAGVVGGLVTVQVWDLLKRVNRNNNEQH